LRWLYAASESCAQISLYVVGSPPSRAVPHVARSPERITGQVNRDGVMAPYRHASRAMMRASLVVPLPVTTGRWLRA
jgi:hypothetical protein